MTSYKERITENLTKALHPIQLDVIDQSHMHEGHAGHRPGGETHFKVIVVSKAFEGLNRVARQRLVFDALKAELEERVHALSITAKAPDEV
ncbi:MAG: BolA family protein [Sphingomonadales bacterium]|jgi:BolA protein